MEYIQMAENVTYSRIVLGFWRLLEWNLSLTELSKFIDEVLELGITTFDHADIYGDGNAERVFGDVLKKHPGLRKKTQLITKNAIVYKSETARVKYYDNSEKHIIGQVEKSLAGFGTDYIDTLLFHRPNPFMDPADVAGALEKLQRDGKVLSFGVCNYKPDDFRMLKSYLTVPLITDQVELSPLNMENLENGVINLCLEERIHPMIWSPLAGGRIFTSDEPEAKRLRDTLEVIRGEISAGSIDEVAFAWLLSHPVKMIPLTGSGEIGLVKKPVQALKYQLTPEQWFMIWTAVKGHKVP
ncbi:MAG TPA: aldo/keto reductase [Anaerovoracaceae bacterium]|nr:aldo/keto reductase [Anaerovoracaceae bacterium]